MGSGALSGLETQTVTHAVDVSSSHNIGNQASSPESSRESATPCGFQRDPLKDLSPQYSPETPKSKEPHANAVHHHPVSTECLVSARRAISTKSASTATGTTLGHLGLRDLNNVDGDGVELRSHSQYDSAFIEYLAKYNPNGDTYSKVLEKVFGFAVDVQLPAF